MSNVTNVIVLVRDCEDAMLMEPFTIPNESRHWSGELSCITNDDADRYWIHDGKGPECDVWVGAFNHFNRKAFLNDLEQLPWSRSGVVQVLILGQDDDCWGLWMLRNGQLQEIQLPDVIRKKHETETSQNGERIFIETGILIDNEYRADPLRMARERTLKRH